MGTCSVKTQRKQRMSKQGLFSVATTLQASGNPTDINCVIECKVLQECAT